MGKIQSLSNGGEKEHVEAAEYAHTALLLKYKTRARLREEQEESILKKAKTFSGCSSERADSRRKGW
jgi:hypothetical protein